MKVKIPVALLLAICFTSIVFAKCPYDGLWYMPSPSWELEDVYISVHSYGSNPVKLILIGHSLYTETFTYCFSELQGNYIEGFWCWPTIYWSFGIMCISPYEADVYLMSDGGHTFTQKAYKIAD
ncbi:MAG TPA: hypothetical protein ENF20_07805 [Candidatus Marinimicrobia bacterium]|nr:hypothetical protein [Candidatus Neomarinimicrobiota bacterium]